MYQNKLEQQGVQAVVNMNKIKLEPYGNLADQFFLNLMRAPLPIKTHIAKLKMMKHQGTNIPVKMIEEAQKQTKYLQFSTSCQKILPGDETAKGINSLNSKQMEVFNVVHTWAEDYVKYNGIMLNTCTYSRSAPRNRGTDQSYLMK